MDLGNKLQPAIVCDKCSTKFCYFHANAHPNGRYDVIASAQTVGPKLRLRPSSAS